MALLSILFIASEFKIYYKIKYQEIFEKVTLLVTSAVTSLLFEKRNYNVT